MEVKSQKTIVIKKVKTERVESDKVPMAGFATPLIGKFEGDKILKRVCKDGAIKISRYSTASLWDGSPKECSWYV